MSNFIRVGCISHPGEGLYIRKNQIIAIGRSDQLDSDAISLIVLSVEPNVYVPETPEEIMKLLGEEV